MTITKILQIVCTQCGECVDDSCICEYCGHDDLVEEVFYRHRCNNCGTDMIDCYPFTACPDCGDFAE